MRRPAIFLLAEKDEIVPRRFQRLVVEAYAGEKRVIEMGGAHHNDPIGQKALRDLNDGIDWMLANGG
jgi:hypothetical protein